MKQITQQRFSFGNFERNGLAVLELLMGGLEALTGWSGDEPTTSVMADRKGSDPMAIDADRGHGKILSPRVARASG